MGNHIYLQKMSDFKRKFKEAVAIAKFEPGLKNIYVEGASDKFLIKNFFSYHKIADATVFEVDSIDFSEVYEGLGDKLAYIKKSNKLQVIHLAQTIEKEANNGSRTLCIIDADWDYVLNQVYAGEYLCYTDYGSMEMYLFNSDIVRHYLQEGHRIANVKEDNLLASLSVLCRQVFHIHGLLHERGKQILNNDKYFSFDKKTQMCTINIDKYMEATLNKNGLMAEKEEIKRIYAERMDHLCDDVRKEIRGHDFVYYLYQCTRKIKTKKMDMNDEEFANMFWRFANYDNLAKESLFQRVLAL